MESRLVLEAAGISGRAEFRDGWWWLVVDQEELPDAITELEAYRQENLSRTTAAVRSPPIYSGAVWAVLIYAAVVVLIAVLTAPWGYGLDLFTDGSMQAGLVKAGQWWRAVTALTLHLDEGHVASNLVFGSLFGFLAGKALGGGVAWLSIVIAGAFGNGVNAMVQAPEHTSVGASTAVFAALGVIVANSLRPRLFQNESLLRRWSPLVGGVMLLALIGVGGERTDVLAHVTGFFAGILIGWASSRLPNRRLANDRFQMLAGVSALAIVAIAWTIALSGRG
jgi:membrane associated rhomboid family serine protease